MDRGLQTYTPYKRPSLIQTLFERISAEVDLGRIVESRNVYYKLCPPSFNQLILAEYIRRGKQ